MDQSEDFGPAAVAVVEAALFCDCPDFALHLS
jgi:hypothetical protein